MEIVDNRKYKSNAIENKSVVDLIKYVSIDAYNRIGFIKKYSNKNYLMRIYEVTMTQNLVYELNKFGKENNLNLLSVYESKDEAANGADILLCVKMSRGYIKIPVQAKILKPYRGFKNGRYKEFWHQNQSGLQFDLLHDYAEKSGSLLALYLFYNYTEGSQFIGANEKESYYGCSYVSTQILKQKYGKDDLVIFGDVHPEFGQPFYKLFENSNGGVHNIPNTPNPTPTEDKDVIDFFRKSGIEINKKDVERIKFYTDEQILTDDINWELEDRLRLDNDNALKENRRGFNPKYKFVLVAHPEKPDHNNKKGLDIVLTPATGKGSYISEYS